METKENKVQEPEYGNWRKYESDDNDFIAVDAGYKPFNDVLNESLEEVMAVQECGCLPGIPTGYPSIDRILGGLKKNDLIVIGGYPGSGKTTLALSITHNAAVENKIPVLYISLESSAVELLKRLLIMQSELSPEFIQGTAKMKPEYWAKLECKTRVLQDAPIFIEERPNLTIGHIRNIVRQQIEKNKIKLVIIDYMQLIKGREECRINREQEMSNVSRELKSLAKECQIPIVAISSLSRQTSGRQDRYSSSRPQTSDLRDSGSIEFESDVILLMNDNELIGLSEDPGDYEKLQIKIAKNRDGECADLEFTFKKYMLRIMEIENHFEGIPSKMFDETSDNADPFSNNNSEF